MYLYMYLINFFFPFISFVSKNKIVTEISDIERKKSNQTFADF
jgi:hypothetical protein